MITPISRKFYVQRHRNYVDIRVVLIQEHNILQRKYSYFSSFFALFLLNYLRVQNVFCKKKVAVHRQGGKTFHMKRVKMGQCDQSQFFLKILGIKVAMDDFSNHGSEAKVVAIGQISYFMVRELTLIFNRSMFIENYNIIGNFY